MTNVMFCKICLNVDVKMYNLEEYSLEECYKNVIGNSYEQNLTSLQYACYECAYFIQKYYLFKQKCLRSQSYLTELFKKNGKITLSEINCIDRQNLHLCSNLSSVINLAYDQVSHCDIKIEFDVNESINANNATSAQDHNFKTEERMKQEDEAQDGDFEIEPIFTLPFEKKDIPKLKKNNTDKKSPQRKIKFIEVSLKGTSNDCVEQAVNESIKEENNSVPTCIKKHQSRAIKKRRKTEPERNSNESTREETSIRDNVTVVKLTLQEQIQEVLKRKNSSNYLNAEYKCNLCYKGFIDPDAYSHHMKRHDTVSGSKQCPVCKIAFPTQRALQRHTGNHDKHYICKTCSQVSKTLTQAKQHQHSHTGKIYKCEHCGNISLKLSSYLTHIRLKHPSEFVCEICSYSFVSKLGLSRHKSMMHKYQVAPQDSTEKQVRYCKACNVFFNSPQNWKRHIASVGHKIKTSQDFTCGMCKEILPSGDELRLHNRLVHPRRGVRRVVNARVPRVWPAKCQHCDSELLNAHKYFYHIRKAHPDEPYSTPKNHVCDICGKRYRANAFLVYHRRTHFNERPYKCTKCPKAFFNRINLLGHEKSHSDQRPFPCSVCCKAFKTHGGLQRHFLCHTGEKPYACELCGKTFSQSNSVKVHVKTVHLKEPAPYVSRNRLKRSGRRAPTAAASAQSIGTDDPTRSTELEQSNTDASNTSFY